MLKYVFILLVLFAAAVVFTPDARAARGGYGGCAGQAAGCAGAYAGCSGSGGGCAGRRDAGPVRRVLFARGPIRRLLFGRR